MHNEGEKKNNSGVSEFAIEAEKFGLNNADINISRGGASAGQEFVGVTRSVGPKIENISSDILLDNSEEGRENEYMRLAESAAEVDKMFQKKEIGIEFEKVVSKAMKDNSDDPAELNRIYNELGRQALKAMFGRVLGGKDAA